jgi:hypothetical protein
VVFFLGSGLLEVWGHAAGPAGRSVMIWLQQEIGVGVRVGDDPVVGERPHVTGQPVPFRRIGERGVRVERGPVARAVVDVRDECDVAHVRDPVTHLPDGLPGAVPVGKDDHAGPRPAASGNVQRRVAVTIESGDLDVQAWHYGYLLAAYIFRERLQVSNVRVPRAPQ